MADQQRPSPAQLWQQSGGGTRAYDRDRYLELLREHGHLIPKSVEQTCELTELPVSMCSHCRGLDQMGREIAEGGPTLGDFGPTFEARYPGQCGICDEPIEPGDQIRAAAPVYVHASCVDGA